MKKLSALAISALILFSSCKKEGSGNDNYHVSFTVDGVSKSYTGYAIAHGDTTGSDIELTILGAKSVNSYDDYFGIYINNYPGGGNIPAGQYSDNSADFTVLSTFQNGSNGNEYEAGQTMADDAVYYNVPIANHFKVNIISMDGKTARGTFSGDYYQDGDIRSNKISITNGDFYVKFQ
jgi:hypothetical protein